MFQIRTLNNRCFFGHFTKENDINPRTRKAGVACYTITHPCRLFFAKLFCRIVPLRLGGSVILLNKVSLVKWLERHGESASFYDLPSKINRILQQKLPLDLTKPKELTDEQIPLLDTGKLSLYEFNKIFEGHKHRIQLLTSAQIEKCLDKFSSTTIKFLTDEQIKGLDFKGLSDYQLQKLLNYPEKKFLQRAVPLLSKEQVQLGIDSFDANAIQALTDPQIKDLDLSAISNSQFKSLFGYSQYVRPELLKKIELLSIDQIHQGIKHFGDDHLKALSDTQLSKLDLSKLDYFQFSNLFADYFDKAKQKRIQILSKEQFLQGIKSFDRIDISLLSDSQLNELIAEPELNDYKKQMEVEKKRRFERANAPPKPHPKPQPRPMPQYHYENNFEDFFKDFDKIFKDWDDTFKNFPQHNNNFRTNPQFHTRYSNAQEDKLLPPEAPNIEIPEDAPVLKGLYNEYLKAKASGNYIQLFGLGQNYTDKELNIAFKKKIALKLHPDKNLNHSETAETLFKLFNQIREYLIKLWVRRRQ